MAHCQIIMTKNYLQIREKFKTDYLNTFELLDEQANY